MSAVINLIGYTNRREKSLLEKVLAVAGHVRIHGLAICVLTDDGSFIKCTGALAADSDQRLIAALRLSRHLNQMEDRRGGR
jgi:hypothetical protein